MADFLSEKQNEITKRLQELAPVVDEYRRLEQAEAALAGVDGAPRAVGRRGPGRPRAATKPAAAKRSGGGARKGAGRPKGAGKRASEALALVEGQPGITIPELAEKMKINKTYLYRVLPALGKEGKVRKDGRGWHPTGS